MTKPQDLDRDNPALKAGPPPLRPRRVTKRSSRGLIVALGVFAVIFVVALVTVVPDGARGSNREDEDRTVTSSKAAAERMLKGFEAGMIPAEGSARVGTGRSGGQALGPDGRPLPNAGSAMGRGAGSAATKSGSSTRSAADKTAADFPSPQSSAGQLMPPDGSQSGQGRGGSGPAANPSALAQEELEEQDEQRRTMAALRQDRFLTSLQGRLPVSIPKPDREATHGPATALEKLERVRAKRAALAAAGPGGASSYLEKLALLKESGLVPGTPAEAADSGSSAPGGAYVRFDGAQDRWALGNTLQDPTTPYELRAGAIIPAVLNSHINSDLPGPIRATVSMDVRDTATGNHVLIPQGCRLLGTYASGVKFGQDGLLVAWQRIVFPDGKALDIGAMPGADSSGQMGLRDLVDNHYFRIFGAALLMSGITAGIAVSQDSMAPDNNRVTIGGTLTQSLGNQLGQLSQEMIRRNLEVAPTIEVRPGKTLVVEVQKDLVFDSPYRPFDYQRGVRTADGRQFGGR